MTQLFVGVSHPLRGDSDMMLQMQSLSIQFEVVIMAELNSR